MIKEHNYNLSIEWTGNTGTGTSGYKNYERSHSISVCHKKTILASSDPEFRGDKTKINPEELFLASVSSCHMLWYLHLCSAEGIIVTNYTDNATGIMEESANGSGKFTSITLNPVVTISDISMETKANELHKKANECCFIANSLNIPVQLKPRCIAGNNS